MLAGGEEDRFRAWLLLLATTVIFLAWAVAGATLYFATDDWTFLERSLDFSLLQALSPFLPDRLFYRPLSQDLYFRLLFRLVGLRSVYYHLLNQVLFAGNLFLIYLLGKRLTSARLPALWALFMYAGAWINVRLYFWVSAVQDLLMITLGLLATLCFIQNRAQTLAFSQRERSSCFSLPLLTPVFGPFCFGLSLLSKESALWLPLWFWLYDFFTAPTNLGSKLSLSSRLKLHLPYDLLLLVYLGFRLLFLPAPGEGKYAFALWGRHLLENFGGYLSDSVLSLGFPLEELDPGVSVSLALVIFIGLLLISVRRHGWASPVAVGLSWFFLGMSIFLPLREQAYEYYLSLASIGLFVAAGFALESALRRLRPRLAFGLSCVLLLWLTILSALRLHSNFHEHWIPRVARWTFAFHQALKKAHPHFPAGAKILVATDLPLGEDPSLLGLRALYSRPDLRVYLNEQAFEIVAKEPRMKFALKPGFDYGGAYVFSYSEAEGLREYVVAADGSEIAPLLLRRGRP